MSCSRDSASEHLYLISWRGRSGRVAPDQPPRSHQPCWSPSRSSRPTRRVCAAVASSQCLRSSRSRTCPPCSSETAPELRYMSSDREPIRVCRSPGRTLAPPLPGDPWRMAKPASACGPFLVFRACQDRLPPAPVYPPKDQCERSTRVGTRSSRLPMGFAPSGVSPGFSV